ncbi:MAG: c-type cytochrome [Candidatus Binatia bacterium]
MERVLSAVVVAACLALLPATGCTAGEPEGPRLPKNWAFSLPSGNVDAGKAAFLRMQCYSCHKVPGSDVPRARASGGIGPDLVPAYSRLPREFLAESVIDSHKYISGRLDKYTGQDKVSSKMGDYSSIMSVRELIDIVEFLKHLEEGGPK